MGHRSSKQLEEAPSKAIIFQTVHSNDLSTLHIKMKILFVLALVIYFTWSVVLGDDCGYPNSGFFQIGKDLTGSTKEFSFPGEGIENCKNACLARSGCTGFEYNHGGDEDYKCGTYTFDMSDLWTDWGVDQQSSSWTSCEKEMDYL